jgi:hypothetical protein
MLDQIWRCNWKRWDDIETCMKHAGVLFNSNKLVYIIEMCVANIFLSEKREQKPIIVLGLIKI